MMRLGVLAAALWMALPIAPGAQAGPVVVELFTSQGCSSCPPADAILHKLAQRDDVLPLAFHVDYWDYIGWKDRFADPAHTRRQKAYAAAAGRNMIYTPQMIVMGQEDIVGADAMAVMELVAKHRQDAPAVKISLRRSGDELEISLQPAAGGSGGPYRLQLIRYAPLKSVDITRGELARLEHAVLRFAMDLMIERGFEPAWVPVLVRPEPLEGTGYFPGGIDQIYQCDERDDLYLVGTAEVPLTSLHAGEILSEDQLPIKLVAQSSCFRREAGTYGKDTRGLYRVHQFQKVEQVILDVADEAKSLAHHQAILQNAEDLLQAFELPYRVVNVCGGDLGAPQIQKFDVETWMPSREGYGETHSASRFHGFQARRLNLRYRDGDGKVHFCHTLNNTVAASSRILIALMENHQTEDGRVRVPEALRGYLGGLELIGRALDA